MGHDQFFYDSTGFNTLEALADLVLQAAEGDLIVGSEDWHRALLELPIDSLNEFNSPEFAQLKLEEVLRERLDNAGQIERFRAIGDQAIEDLYRLHQPGFS
jgi:hypothetical protein